MKYFAILDGDVVVDTIVLSDNNCGNLDFPKSEIEGRRFLRTLGETRKVLEYHPHGVFRKIAAAKGYTFNPRTNAFVSPQPFPSWNYNRKTGQWQAPIKKPKQPGHWAWNETKQMWYKKG